MKPSDNKWRCLACNGMGTICSKCVEPKADCSRFTDYDPVFCRPCDGSGGYVSEDRL